MLKMNLGCGPDIIESFLNVDSKDIALVELSEGVIEWNAVKDDVPYEWQGKFDFVLLNHVLCTMTYDDARKVLKKCYKMLCSGGRIQVIDMDVLKAIEDFQNGAHHLPIEFGTAQWKLCMHLSGFSTRHSLYTNSVLFRLLGEAGFDFNQFEVIENSKYDSRPKESIAVEMVRHG